MRSRRRRRSSSRTSVGERLVPGDDRRARRPGGDDMRPPRTAPRRRLGTTPTFPSPGEVCARGGDGGDGGFSRASLSLPADPGLLRNRDAGGRLGDDAGKAAENLRTLRTGRGRTGQLRGHAPDARSTERARLPAGHASRGALPHLQGLRRAKLRPLRIAPGACKLFNLPPSSSVAVTCHFQRYDIKLVCMLCYSCNYCFHYRFTSVCRPEASLHSFFRS